MIIGLTGTIASGKGTVADFFKKKGFIYFSLSDQLREKVKEMGLPVSRENLHAIGNKLRKEYGKGVLAELVKEKLTKYGYPDAIIDGIRNPGEIEAVRALRDFFLIAVDAPAEIRFERIKKRNRENDPHDWDEFLRLDERDKKGCDEWGQWVSKCIELADFVIINDDSIMNLSTKLEELYKKMVMKISRRS
ncbi:MAG: AAA family ATPase [Planctomycetota bacterium]